MRQRQKKTFTKLGILFAVALGIGFVIYQFSSPKDSPVSFYSIGDSFELSIAPNYLIKCSINDQLYVKFSGDATRYPVNSAYQTFNPQITYELLSTTSKRVIVSFPSDIELNCDVPSGYQTTVEGNLLVSVTAYNSKGQQIEVLSPTVVSISQRTVPDNSVLKLPSYLINQATIDSKLDTGTGSYTSQIRVFIVPNLTFKIPTIGSISKYQNANLITSYVALVQKQSPIISSATGTILEIDAYSPKIFQKPLTNTQRYVSVTARADHWLSTEGLPYLIVRTPTSAQYQKVLFVKYSNLDGDIYTEFVTAFQLPEDPMVGTWTFQMKSDQPLRQASGIRTLDVIQAKTSPTPTPSQTPTPTPTSSNTALGKVKFKYDIIFKTGDTVGCQNIEDYSTCLVPPEGFNIDLVSLALTKTDRGELKPLSSIGAESIAIFDDTRYKNMNIIRSEIQHTGTVSTDGRQATLTAFELSPLTLNTRDKDGNFHLAKFRILASDLEKKIQGTGTNALKEGQAVNVTVTASGNFVLTDSQGKQYKGVVSNAQLTYSFFYTGISGGSVGDPEPCQGLSGEAKLACEKNDPNYCVDFVDVIGDENCTVKEPQTGGECKGLTPAECLEKGKTILQDCIWKDIFPVLCGITNPPQEVTVTCDPAVVGTSLSGSTCYPTVAGDPDKKPIASSGLGIICPDVESLSGCIESLKTKGSGDVLSIDTTTLVLIIALVVFIIILVAVLARGSTRIKKIRSRK